MALQSGIGFSKIIILAGAGYTSTVLLMNGKLSDVFGELQSLVKRFEHSVDKGNGESDYSEAVAAQVRRLAMEVKQLASARQITVLNGNSSQTGNLSTLVMPAATLGALGYGYMWWKGLKFSDLMYVTKQNMANAVSNLTDHLQRVKDGLSETKRHLTQRIQHVNDKLDDQKELSKIIKDEVTDVRGNLSDIGCDLDALRKMVSGLGGKICTLEEKQDFANAGVFYLCNFVDGKKMKMPEMLQDQLKVAGRSRGFQPSLTDKGLRDILDSLAPGNANNLLTGANMEGNIDNTGVQQRGLLRTASAKS